MMITKDSVFEQVNKFLQFLNNGQKASFKIECENGEAVMDMSVCFQSTRKTTRHSPSKIKRNKVRAEMYRKKRQLEFEKQHAPDIISDFNGNEELNLVECFDENRLSSILSFDNDYQFCFMDDDNCNDCDLISNEPEEDFEIEFSLEQNESEHEDVDTDKASCIKRKIELESEQWEFDDFNDVFHMNQDFVTDNETYEISFGDRCTVGPTVHYSHHANESASASDDEEDKLITERKIIFEEMAGGGGYEEPFITEWEISEIYNLKECEFRNFFVFDDGCCCRIWTSHDFGKYYFKTCPDCGVAPVTSKDGRNLYKVFMGEWEKG